MSRNSKWIALYLNGSSVIQFDTFGVEHTLKALTRFIGKKIL